MASTGHTATANVKVSQAVRDRINTDARAEGVTPAVFLERLVERWEREQFLTAVRDAYAASSPQQSASLDAEAAA
ncbi:MAG: hypothetical protein LBQ06_00505, partial [Frankiaceae bacterium]|nr:hypothetical protein [Frankiaceae bacterium]